MKYSILFIFLSLFAYSCVHKPYPVPVITNPTPPETCDTINTSISYHQTVQPLIAQNCYSCHGTSVTTTGGLDLENFTSLKNYLQNGFRGDGVYGSKLYHCITHSSLALPMPPTYVLDTCSLKVIKRWLDTGAPDN